MIARVTKWLSIALRLMLLAACVGVVYLGASGAGPETFKFVVGRRHQVYEVRLGRRFELRTMPAGPAEGENRARLKSREMTNGDVLWSAYVEEMSYGSGSLSLQASHSGSSSDATAELRRGSAAESLWADFTPAARTRPLLEALEDPHRFVAAHMVLSFERQLALGPVEGRAEDAGTDAALTFDRLHVHVPMGEMTPGGIPSPHRCILPRLPAPGLPILQTSRSCVPSGSIG